jgi:pSer/pThr/pTyr-binding forkhead associated (FHA) protein
MAMIVQTVDGVVTNKFEIGQTVLKFGRSADNQVQIDDLAVSGHHSQIICKTSDTGMNTYFLEDLGSTNGTYINDKKIEKKQLHHNDSLRIGWNFFTFIDENETDFEKTTVIRKSWIPGIYFTRK